MMDQYKAIQGNVTNAKPIPQPPLPKWRNPWGGGSPYAA